MAGAAWKRNFDRDTRRLVQQSLTYRGLNGEPAERAVGLPGADEGPRMDLTCALVADLRGATKRKRRREPFAGIDDDGVPQPLPKPEDPRLQVRLVLLSRVILAVFLEVAMAAGGSNARRDVTAPNRLQFPEFRLESREARLGDWLALVSRNAHLGILARNGRWRVPGSGRALSCRGDRP